ncbi:MAG: DNA mismatch repair protein MutS [Armatimonadota bacterium]
MTKKLTPMLRQYMNIKEENPDVILMFRLGDFYEIFGEDAKVASKELEITLTGRNAGEAGRIPMCGVPFHAVDRYVARLIQRGYRVAICDQVEDPKQAKGLVRRQVTRVVTPGTVLEDSMLKPGSNNYLLAVREQQGKYGLAVADISTGEFLVTEITGPDAKNGALDEVNRLSPAEILVPVQPDELSTHLQEVSQALFTPFEPEGFVDSRKVLLEQFNTASLRGFGCEEYTCGISAAALILKYLETTQAAALGHIRSISTYSTSGFMVLDAPARRNLELTQSISDGARNKSLVQILDHTVTPMGSRLMRKWLDQPLLDVSAIERRLSAVDDLFNSMLARTKVRESLSGVYDLERLTSRTVTGTANARDLIALRNSIRVLPELQRSLDMLENPALIELNRDLGSLDGIALLISSAIVEEPPVTVREGGLIKPGFSADLDELRSAGSHGKEWIAALESSEKERTGIKNLKVGFNSVFGYYIEVSKSNLSLVPENYIRKQTTVNGERYITPELKEWEAKVLGAEEKSTAMEYQIFSAVREQVAADAERLMIAARAIARVDVFASLAEVASANRFVRPAVNTEDAIKIKNGRHPVVERLQTGELFVPNDALLDSGENQLLIITGPNMAGKSTYLRQVALIVLVAQIGSFVPADSAEIGIVDRIFTRVGAHDELHSGQSTFMVEMTETADILNNATERSLIVLDEIGRGTSTFDGLSIAWAVAEHIKKIGAKTLFATHYHHLNELANRYPGIKNYRIAVREDNERVIWLRKIMPGGTDKSYGIQVARLAGLPVGVIERAQEVLSELEAGDGGCALQEQRIPTKKEKLQLTLFEASAHPVLTELSKLDVGTITPIEALTKLYDFQNRLKRN